ncbi:hypothetical protein PYEL_30340 [Pseudomonas sp. URMO17WK12:I11]|nr:hypothetical protein PYEL_30340 [Pseudomonas sp. URMO17WK12:I11]
MAFLFSAKNLHADVAAATRVLAELFTSVMQSGAGIEKLRS